MIRTVDAAMDDGTHVTAEVVRESQNPGQRGWLLLRWDDLLWWAAPGEYANLPRRKGPHD